MFGKYKIALANPRKSPLTPLKKRGNRIKVPLFKGDLGGFTHWKRSNWTHPFILLGVRSWELGDWEMLASKHSLSTIDDSLSTRSKKLDLD
jgi:hypothetical protein